MSIHFFVVVLFNLLVEDDNGKKNIFEVYGDVWSRQALI